MKRLTLIIIGVLLCTPLYSDMNPYIAGVRGCDYLVQEDFEGTGTPSGWAKLSDRPLPNFDYTSTVLEGTESMYLAGTGYHKDSAASTPTQLAGTDRHVAFMFRVPSLPSADIGMLQLYNSTTLLGIIGLRTNGGLYAQIAGGSVAYGTSGAISANTTYYVKVRWQAGEPATLTAWISSDGSSWTQKVRANNADQTLGVTYNTFRSDEGYNYTPIIDLVREANEDINY
jgi:hypothetical protein